ncbi:hypothetical protein [Desulfomarina sp.]
MNLTSRLSAVLVLACAVLWTRTGVCQDFFSGKVLWVDRDRRELTVEVRHGTKLFGDLAGKKPVLVRIAENNNLPVNESGILLPPCVSLGNTVRLWGVKVAGEPPFFVATDIRGCRGGACDDPTGVRSRLQKHRRNRVEKKSWWSNWILSGEEKEGAGRGSGGRSHGGVGGGRGGGGEGGGHGGGGGGRR